jgi:hypothetical protein
MHAEGFGCCVPRALERVERGLPFGVGAGGVTDGDPGKRFEDLGQNAGAAGVVEVDPASFANGFGAAP